jgi:flagellar motor switch protein FliN
LEYDMNYPIEKVLDDLSAQGPAGRSPIVMHPPESGTSHHPSPANTPFASDAILAIPVTIQVVLGTARLPISKIAELRPGSIINLDQNLGTPAAILVNGREVAKGDLFVLEGEEARLGITITEVIRPPASRTAS